MKLLKIFAHLILFAIYLQTSTCILNDSIEPNENSIVDVQPRDVIQDSIDGILNNVTDAIVALDPVMIVDKSITLPDNTFINGNIGLTNLTISDFKSLDISAAFHLGFFSSTLDFKIELPKLNLHLEYENELQLGTIPDHIINKGTIDLGLENFLFNGTCNINTLALNVGSTDAHIDLEKVNLVLTGFLQDEELSEILGTLISDNAVKLLHEYQDEIDENLGLVITTLANLVIKSIIGEKPTVI